MRSVAPFSGAITVIAAIANIVSSAQQPFQMPPLVAVRPIEPPRVPIPPEPASAAQRRFSFIAYGDARASSDQAVPEVDHAFVVDAMLGKIKALASSAFPVRFVLQSGDAVYNGAKGEQWNISFSPLIEKITRGAGVPYFFSMGNHDAGLSGEASRPVGVHNALAAMAKLIPPEGSPRRLNGYPTYAFGYGNVFVIVIDSNIAGDALQRAWVTDQLEHLDRDRYRHVIVMFHHPLFSSGPHGGVSPGPTAPTTVDNVERPTAALRASYAPLFRRFHVRMTITGHDHLFDHFVERYEENGVTHRRDDVVTGGGGAPIYRYRGEPETEKYLAAGVAQNVRLEHVMKPGMTAAENPHHFVVIRVDGDRLALEVVGVGRRAYTPYSGQSRIELN